MHYACTFVRMNRKPWTYKGLWVFPADLNSSGIRWSARMGTGEGFLRASSKVEMRQLITTSIKRRKQ